MRSEIQQGGEAPGEGINSGSDCSADALIPKRGEEPPGVPARAAAARVLVAAAVVLVGAVTASQARRPARGAARGEAPAFRALSEEAGPLVNTTAGLVRGTLEGGVACFFGVPFARPPVRFAAPEPAEPWGGVRDAKRTPRKCYQNVKRRSASESEDCLLLNICTRAGSLQGGGKLQPVVVWLHPGYFNTGGCSDNADSFTKLTGGVSVCPQYRLGAFGFFSTSATPSVLGLQDQQLALKWVQQNAQAFGGDPDRVLITGPSAGGASVAGHLALPSSAGLFTSASLQSPGIHMGWRSGGPSGDWISAEDSLRSSTALAHKLGCRGPADLGCLRAATAEEVVKAALATGMRFAPALPGGEFPQRLIRKGRWNRVPVVVGACSCEGCCQRKGARKMLAARDISEEEFRADLLRLGFDETRGAAVGPEKIEKWYAGRLREENRSQVEMRVAGDASWSCSAKLHADALQQGADPAHSGVWRFYFDLFGSKSGAHVAGHLCAEWWIFGRDPVNAGLVKRPEPGAFSLQVHMAHWWYSLAAFGDPNVGSTSNLHWPEYSAESPQTLIVDEVSRVGVTKDTQAKECSHWQQYFGFE